MTYICQLCSATCDQYGNPESVVDPLAKTMAITCISCRLKACAEKSRGRPIGYKVQPKFNPKLNEKIMRAMTASLPYKDE